MSVIFIMSYIISLVLILQPEVYVLWLPSSGTPSSTPFICNHRYDPFFYEFICFWSLNDMQHLEMITLSLVKIRHQKNITELLSVFSMLCIPWLCLIYFAAVNFYLFISLTCFTCYFLPSLKAPLLWQSPVCFLYL